MFSNRKKSATPAGSSSTSGSGVNILPHNLPQSLAWSPRAAVETTATPTAAAAATIEDEEAVGLSNPQMSGAQRRMLDLVNGLHSTGVQVDIELPQIAVIGNQSAGKSSLIESISGITLPRASGCCTRCPTECRLSYSSSPWKCIVSLRIMTSANGQPLGQCRNEAFGDPIFNKRDVEDRIRRAQLAILNPGKPAGSFLNGNENNDELYGSEGGSLTFSMNCVSLAISGPEVTDLSFVDLPGLIATVGRDGNSADIKLVESLVTSYIKKSNCIILLTVACETDFENQGAYHLARQYDPEGKRTIGVLTKPDRISPGDEQNWVQFIRNEKEPLQNNWFCVKQPSSNELKQNWTWKQAREKEREFFAGTYPWNELESIYTRHLRTRNLVERLSQVLSDLIAIRLPEIRQELEAMIKRTRKQISSLPKPPPQNALSEVAKLIKDFDANMKRHIEGVPYRDGIIQKTRVPFRHFRSIIRNTAPDFQPFYQRRTLQGGFSLQLQTQRVAEPDFLKHEEEEDVISTGPGVADIGPGVAEGGEYVTSTGTGVTEEEGIDVEQGGPIYVDEVYRRMQESVTRELPGFFPFVVPREYITEIQAKWQNPAMWLCEQVHRILVDHTRELVRQHFANFGQGPLEHQVRLIMNEHLGSCLEAAKAKIDWMMKIHRDPFTQNIHYLTDYKEKFLTYYRSVRQDALTKHRSSGFMAQQDDEILTTNALNNLRRLGFDVKKKDLNRLLGPDVMDPALDIMATVRAYFQVAYKRFVDYVPMAIDYELVQQGEQDIFQLLWTKLELDGPNAHQMCDDFAKEAKHIADGREQLEKKLERLNQAMRRLMG